MKSITDFQTEITTAYHTVNLFMRKKFGLLWFVPYLVGSVFPGVIPHARNDNIMGFLDISADDAKKLSAAANSSKLGVASFWIAGVLQSLYVTHNASRNVLVREGLIGVTSEKIRNYTKLAFNNNVMVNFLIWMNIHSDLYQKQRGFLNTHFAANVDNLLSGMDTNISDFIKHTVEEKIPLRKFVYALVLYIGSRLPVINFSTFSFDALFLTNPEFEEAIYKVARYGISQKGDRNFEIFLYKNFCLLFEKNFSAIANSDTNLLKNIFLSRQLSFPNCYEEFENLAEDIKFQIAMNFMSVAIGGMVHTTANSFDWLLAGLALNRDNLMLLQEIVRTNKAENLTDRQVYESTLRPIRDLVIANVLKNPTFTHELFACGQAFDATLPDATAVHIPKGSLILVDYLACNRAEPYFKSDEAMRTFLANKSTGHISLDKSVASFGGSIVNRQNNQTRVCPGRNFSLFEQMIMLTVLLKECDLEFEDVNYSTDENDLPVHARTSTGTICLKPKLENNLQISSTQLSFQFPIETQNTIHYKNNSMYLFLLLIVMPLITLGIVSDSHPYVKILLTGIGLLLLQNTKEEFSQISFGTLFSFARKIQQPITQKFGTVLRN